MFMAQLVSRLHNASGTVAASPHGRSGGHKGEGKEVASEVSVSVTVAVAVAVAVYLLACPFVFANSQAAHFALLPHEI